MRLFIAFCIGLLFLGQPQLALADELSELEDLLEDDPEAEADDESAEEMDAAVEEEPISIPGTHVVPVLRGTKDQSIYLIQRRAFSKKSAFEFAPLGVFSLNNKFVGHYGLGFSATYHMRENLALDFTTTIPFLFGAYYAGLVYDVYEYESLTPEVVDLKQMNYFGALSAQFSALYGKMVFYDWVMDYDVYLSAGFGLTSTLETCVPSQDGCGEDVGIGRGLRSPEGGSDRFKIAGHLGGGMRVFFSDFLGYRVEVRDVAYPDLATEAGWTYTDIQNRLMILIGVSFLL